LRRAFVPRETGALNVCSERATHEGDESAVVCFVANLSYYNISLIFADKTLFMLSGGWAG
jgi:hypothetical protein